MGLTHASSTAMDDGMEHPLDTQVSSGQLAVEAADWAALVAAAGQPLHISLELYMLWCHNSGMAGWGAGLRF